MGTSEVLKILKKGDKKTSLEISKELDTSIRIISAALKRLLNDTSEEIEFRTLTQEEKIKRYGKKVGSRIYIYWSNGVHNGQDAKRMAV